MSAPAIPATLAEPVGAAVHAASTAAAACASCGAALLGEFCHACGERRVRPDEMTLRVFAGDVAAEVGNLDGRTPRSIAYLLTRPGFLTAEYLAGRRRGYVGPLKLFVVAYALVLLGSALAARSGTAVAERLPEGSWMRRLLNAIASRHGWSAGEALERLNAVVLSHMGWLQLLIPLLFGAAVALVFVRRRRGFVEHVVFAAHVATFQCALSLLLMPVAVGAERLPQAVVSVAGAGMIGVMGWYLWRAVARVYGDTGWRGALRAAALLVGFNLAQGIAGAIALCTAVVALLYF
ncbi:MAG TPA: DUF3667 domain-containing protein [Longimicrobium sp.]|nr:DUF3667 domain-containing protein [Longimicrobium sp.]